MSRQYLVGEWRVELHTHRIRMSITLAVSNDSLDASLYFVAMMISASTPSSSSARYDILMIDEGST